ncbi:MAG: phosphatidylglycerophosphatase A [Pseudomonadota bacterium]
MKSTTPPSVWSNLTHFFAFGCGVGALPYAPGTFGTLLAVPVYLLVQPLPLWLYIAHTLFLLVLGVWLCHVTARDLGVEDHPGIVWDEIVGFLITMTAAPPGWMWLVLGFALFRFFDIWKPWPLDYLERRMKGGVGIMIDDVGAGLYALLVLQLLVWLQK